MATHTEDTNTHAVHTHAHAFSQVEMHHQNHNHRHTNTRLHTNRGQVMTQDQMFPRDSFADLLSRLSTICHEDGWENVRSCAWWAPALFMCVRYVRHKTGPSYADGGRFENVCQKLENSARLFSQLVSGTGVCFWPTSMGTQCPYIHTWGWALGDGGLL